MVADIIWEIAKALCLVMTVGTGCFFLGCLSLAIYKYVIKEE